MKQFTRLTLLFFLPLIAIGIGLEGLLRHIPNDYTYKRAYLDQYADTIQTLILGSSHAYYGLDPAYFTSETFNAAHVSQSLDLDELIFQRYRSDLRNLKTLIVTISYPSLFQRLEGSVESWRLKNYVCYYGMPNTYSYTYFSELLSGSFRSNVDRVGSYYLYGFSPVFWTERGWASNYKAQSDPDFEITGSLAAQRHTVDLKQEEYLTELKRNKKLLMDMAAWCEERAVRLVFLTTPVAPDYVAHLRSQQLEDTVAAIADVADRCSVCHYLNLLEDARFSGSDFFDADHLSDRGAAKLSMLINAYLEE